MRTIIQHIGPLYGELNIGSAFGQPNGSLAVGQNLVPTPTPTPAVPTTETEIWSTSYYVDSFYGFTYFKTKGNYLVSSESNGVLTSTNLFNISLLSDVTDTNTVVKLQVAKDSDFSSIVYTSNLSISPSASSVVCPLDTTPTFTSGTTYYFRILLYSSAGNYLYKKSSTISMVGVS